MHAQTPAFTLQKIAALHGSKLGQWHLSEEEFLHCLEVLLNLSTLTFFLGVQQNTNHSLMCTPIRIGIFLACAAYTGINCKSLKMSIHLAVLCL